MSQANDKLKKYISTRFFIFKSPEKPQGKDFDIVPKIG